MTEAEPARRAAPRQERRGYDKGEETRRTILDTALTLFGEAGFEGVTTRQIAAAAGVNLPAIKYYFGGKEGLYLDCAGEVLEHWRRHTGERAESAAAALGGALDAEEARRLLKGVFGDLKNLLADSTGSKAKLEFLSREMNQPAPAYELLYAELWRPGVALVAGLIAAAKQQSAVREAERLDAALLLSSLSVATLGGGVTKRLLGWREIGAAELDALFAAIDRRIDALGARSNTTHG